MFAVAASESCDDTLLQELIKAAQDYERFLAAQSVQSGAGRDTAAAPSPTAPPPATAAAVAAASVGGMFCT